MRKKIVAGNWKMNKTLDQGLLLVEEILQLEASNKSSQILKIIAPPFIHLSSLTNRLKMIENFEVAAQNCHTKEEGAYTGEVSAKMIASVGCKYLILGHSERRQYFKETNKDLAEKINVGLDSGLIPIFCIGENLEERSSSQYLNVIKTQLSESVFHLSVKEITIIIIAYEPVLAIGTGKTATIEQIQEIHSYIRLLIKEQYNDELANSISILYGGSCNAENAKSIFSCKDVDGGLIGGASLKAEDFITITVSF